MKNVLVIILRRFSATASVCSFVFDAVLGILLCVYISALISVCTLLIAVCYAEWQARPQDVSEDTGTRQ
jgi:hypothetical protein